MIVRNFDDLEMEFEFTYKGEKYLISPISQATSERLSILSGVSDAEVPTPSSLTKEQLLEMNRFVFKYVLIAILGDDYSEDRLESMMVDPKYNRLPRKLLSNVMDVITSEMLGLDSKEVKKEEAKK